jgi:hypothetical protein
MTVKAHQFMAKLGQMDAKNIIRDAVTRVSVQRQTAAADPALAQAVSHIKRIQARRFSGSYADLLHSDQYKPAALFFLEELYSEKDYTLRDAQFARIAGALERIFPHQVVQTAVSMAQLHALTEELDLAMATQWRLLGNADDASNYVKAWRAVGRRADRQLQLSAVMEVGRELDRLTRTPGLRLMLKMMRGPANLAGLGSLQRFLESGFDTFAAMGRKGQGADFFLNTVMDRESSMLNRLFDADAVACETELAHLLGQPR